MREVAGEGYEKSSSGVQIRRAEEPQPIRLSTRSTQGGQGDAALLPDDRL